MKLALGVVLAGCLCLLFGGARALAAARPLPTDYGSNVSYSIWDISGPTVRVRFMLPMGEAAPLLPPKARPDASAVGEAILPLLHVESAAGECGAIDQGQGAGQVYNLYATPGLYRYEIIFDCPSADGIRFRDDVLFDKVPSHVDYASVQIVGKPASFQMFTRGDRGFVLPPNGQPLADAGQVRLVQRGLQAVLGQPDRLCVLLGLLLVVTCWSDLLRVGAALALGCVTALAAALLGQTTSSVSSEAAIGLVAAVLAATALRRDMGAVSWRSAVAPALAAAGVVACALFAVWRAPDSRWLVAGLAAFSILQVWAAGAPSPARRWLVLGPVFLFGVLEGLVLTRDLLPLPFTPWRLAPTLVAYDVGLLIGGIGLVAAVVGLMWLFRRRLLPVRPWAFDAAAAGLVGVGVFWFVSRLHT